MIDTDPTVSIDVLLSILGAVGTVAAIWAILRKERRASEDALKAQFQTVHARIDKHSEASERGRKAIHDRMDEQHRDFTDQLQAMRRETAETYVRRDLHERDMRSVQQITDEQQQIINSLAGRVCPVVSEVSHER